MSAIVRIGHKPICGIRHKSLEVKRVASDIGAKKCDQRYNSVNEKVGANEEDTSKKEARFNPLGIQMISSNLKQKLFGNSVDKSFDKRRINEILKQLKSHGLNPKKTNQGSKLIDHQIEKYMPKLLASNLSDHFQILGRELSTSYKKLAFNLIDKQMPEPPNHWLLREGWTRYVRNSDGSLLTQEVDFPLENELIFDVEVCMSDGQKPTLASAVSPQAWYSWCSRRLTHLTEANTSGKKEFDQHLNLDDLIPIGKALEDDKIVVGHNVSFDRSYIKEQYDIKCDRTRFLDTMSLHICVSGLTQHQRVLHYSHKAKTLNDSDETNDESIPHMWSGVGSLNNLVDVYHLYCNDDQEISKDPRNIFISGSIEQVVDNFQDLMTYCSTDVRLTHEIFKSVLPIYLDRFPHPVSLAGMLEMSVMYLPVSPLNWNRYISESDSIYADNERQLNLSLRDIANSSCSLAKNDRYSDDIWLWDLDWSRQSIRIKKEKEKTKKVRKRVGQVNQEDLAPDSKSQSVESVVDRIIATSSQLMKVQPLMPGYPKWYTEFCSKLKYDFSDGSVATDEELEWEPGPYLVSTQMRSVPKLMRLMWNGYPLHYDETHGWGYLTPDYTATGLPDRVPGAVDDNKNTIYFPIKRFFQFIEKHVIKNGIDSEQVLECVQKDLESLEQNKKNLPTKGINDLIEGCVFYRLPHREGPDKRVGNPLSKDFLRRVEDGSLTSFYPNLTNAVLQQSKTISYWKNSSNRIKSQIVVAMDDTNGAILPRVIVAGTVTRRAVEQTWLTASNAVADRLGSELKSIIQCPEGYHYVGADVDSQELWIASLIGDSNYSGIHGSTGIGWMTLEGNKAQGTDMHSQTAKSINISRDQAKVLNYARIYGSGQAFASRFLIQTNPRMNSTEAKEKAKIMFTKTKGIRKTFRISKNVISGVEPIDDETNLRKMWSGGTESDMFNKLEQIAQSVEPRTPVLQCRISRALEPRVVQNYYITSRINWVVQSSAVDFLHIMLVTMKWLLVEMKIDGRFSISIHDELRYLVSTPDRYKAALALQLANLMTRSLFAQELGFNDLPLSVAFFSSVDIDKCLRKEVTLDSKTPSNPLGLCSGYGIPYGESLDIDQLIDKLDQCMPPSACTV